MLMLVKTLYRSGLLKLVSSWMTHQIVQIVQIVENTLASVKHSLNLLKSMVGLNSSFPKTRLTENVERSKIINAVKNAPLGHVCPECQ